MIEFLLDSRFDRGLERSCGSIQQGAPGTALYVVSAGLPPLKPADLGFPRDLLVTQSMESFNESTRIRPGHRNITASLPVLMGQGRLVKAVEVDDRIETLPL